MRTHSSQWMYMIPARLACSRSRLSEVGEPYRPFDRKRDHAVQPHEGRLGYEKWFNAFMKTSFTDFKNAVTMARQSRD
jgi:hypothetical protein